MTLSEKMKKLKRRKELSSEYRTTSFEVEAIRTAGSTADWRLAALLIELEAQFYKLVTL